MKSLSTISRVILALVSLSMIAAFFLPLWQIQLWAPQYPEGLNMKIWHNTLSGSFDIINGLNHYIGMREIKAEMFPEFHYIGILIGIFIGTGLLAAILGTRRWLIVFIAMAFAYGIAALYDFYRWGYDYGHNLNPHAAIVVPGMSYQPPVLGYKNLLNFTAYSGPDKGAWLIIAVSVVAILLLVFEYFYHKQKAVKIPVKAKSAAVVILVTAVFSLSACAGGPEPIRYGQDACHFCKMTLTDKRYGAEILTKKGKAYKFDDLNCMVNYLLKEPNIGAQTAELLAIDFNHPGNFVGVKQGFFLQNDALKSPMRGDVATFPSEAERVAVKTQLGGGSDLDWDKVVETFK